jgi:hypothetical protein
MISRSFWLMVTAGCVLMAPCSVVKVGSHSDPSGVADEPDLHHTGLRSGRDEVYATVCVRWNHIIR